MGRERNEEEKDEEAEAEKEQAESGQEHVGGHRVPENINPDRRHHLRGPPMSRPAPLGTSACDAARRVTVRAPCSRAPDSRLMQAGHTRRPRRNGRQISLATL
ncbi:hypothetical protein MEX01_39210 [Methylorubrum extorquens]|nr:hypothetical protein MEX01_39210 [Methylorubrum extorquens]